jgi:hypothetical protein
LKEIYASRLDRKNQRIVGSGRDCLIGRKWSKLLIEQRYGGQPAELEISQALFVSCTPVLAHVQGADEQITVPFKKLVRRKPRQAAIIFRRDDPLAGDRFHQLDAYFGHEQLIAWVKEWWCIAA